MRVQELDDSMVSEAFGENWSLDARYPAELPGLALFEGWTRLVFVTIGLTRPG
ncbi:hypothetical protein ACFWBR_19175 [Streptomyces sp. NPDC060006]|uniref:hypothetical protein n=1 Tax=unclassified Streptomyces TaxID=2593676 RepID=UPI00369FE021